MVGVGIVGIGFMGMIHYLAYGKVAGGQVVALCSRDPAKLAGDWTGVHGNFGPRGTMMDLSGRETYREFDRLLADPNVHLVDLCVPNDAHAEMAVRALEAGKHVLVEKPIALSLAEADRMIAAATASGRRLMVAHVLPFFPEFAYALECVRSGRYGALRAAHLRRVISRPDWSDGIAESSRSGGPALDLHIHDTHFICLLAGVPTAVQSRGIVESGAVVHLATLYQFEDREPPVAISAVSGALSQVGRPFAHGFELYLEGATLSYDYANLAGRGHVATPLSVILPDGTVQHPEVGAGDPLEAFAAELGWVIDSVATAVEPPLLSSTLARQALAVCLAEMESVEGGKPVMVH